MLFHDFPIKNGGSFHRFFYVYRRITTVDVDPLADRSRPPRCRCTTAGAVAGAARSAPRSRRLRRFRCRCGWPVSSIWRSFNGKMGKSGIPSGEHTKSNGKWPFYSWENLLFLWPFSIAMLVHQRVSWVGFSCLLWIHIWNSMEYTTNQYIPLIFKLINISTDFHIFQRASNHQLVMVNYITLWLWLT